jgi:hypothetical protein
VLEHLKDDKKALIKIYKITNNGGRVFVTVPSINAPLKKLGIKDKFDHESGHLRSYSVDKLARLVKKAGFKIIHKEKTEGLLRNSLFVFRANFIIRIANRFSIVSDLITHIDNLFLSLFGEADVVVVGEKK